MYPRQLGNWCPVGTFEKTQHKWGFYTIHLLPLTTAFFAHSFDVVLTAIVVIPFAHDIDVVHSTC